MTVAGGWSEYHKNISPEADNAFKEAIKGMAGVSYSPVAFAEQVVAGMNYRFFCNAHNVIPNPVNYAAIVEVYKPINGAAKVSSIKTCEEDS